MRVSLALNAVFWSHFMFVYASKYPVPYYTAEDFGIQVKVPPAKYVYGCHVGEQVNFSAMANTAVFRVTGAFWTDSGAQVEDQKRFSQRKVTLHDRLHNKPKPYIFHTFISFEFSIYRVFIVPNLKCIHAAFTMSWPFWLILFPRWPTGWMKCC